MTKILNCPVRVTITRGDSPVDRGEDVPAAERHVPTLTVAGRVLSSRATKDALCHVPAARGIHAVEIEPVDPADVGTIRLANAAELGGAIRGAVGGGLKQIDAVIGTDWRKRWPCSVFHPGDEVTAVFDLSGDLVGLRAPEGVKPESAELGAALALYGQEAA